jgi:hypothetical protein
MILQNFIIYYPLPKMTSKTYPDTLRVKKTKPFQVAFIGAMMQFAVEAGCKAHS